MSNIPLWIMLAGLVIQAVGIVSMLRNGDDNNLILCGFGLILVGYVL